MHYKHHIFENGIWYERQYLEISSVEKNDSIPLMKTGGVYLIAGGLGAIGTLIAKLLLQHYQATVVLIGRSPLSGDKQKYFGELKRLNKGILEYHAVDITVFSEIQTCIANIVKRHGRLDGVIQSACILNDGLLIDKNYADFYAVIRSKVEGTFNLDEATKNLPLDFFVSFSSISSVFGNVGQADYCVANTFLDLFSNWRSEQTQKSIRSGVTISINWPIWQVEGLAIDQATVDFICEAIGIRPLNEEEGVSLFDMLLDKLSPPQIIPLMGDNQKILQQLTYQHPVPINDNGLDKKNVLETVKQIIVKVTKAEAANLTLHTQIGDLGFNSILLAEMASEIQNRLNITIAPSAFFTYTSLEKITDYLFTKLDHSAQSVQYNKSTIASNTINDNVSDNDFAIIGLDGLLPGGPDISSFWQSLLNHQSSVKRIERWQAGNYYAATIPDIDYFDAKFFGISNREAMLMDPQHRLFLQVAYNTIINAGYIPSQLSDVGVFVGVQFNDYQGLLQQWQSSNHPYAATGNAHAMLANRISYVFNLNGPSQTIDTACSSALVAINRALIALKNGECNMALAGAVSLLIDPIVTDAAQSMGILSPQYRCATFDESADGYVRGEGVGCFLIKRLKDAKRDNDPIHAVIKSFAENHGGKANSLTAPNPLAQKKLLLKAYDETLAKQVSYIETHGTGTKLGDPIEIDALTQAFAILHPHAKKGSIYLGAVKTNVGHLEPAAGIPSIMKVIYALKNKQLPANIHFHRQNPYIQLENTPFKLLTENKSWDMNGPLIAGISSFGFGGSNAHLVLMRYEEEIAYHASEKNMYFFTLSARTLNSLTEMRQQLASFLKKEGSNYPLQSISFTLNAAREHFEHRFAIVTNNLNDLIQALTDSQYKGTATVLPKEVSSQCKQLDDVMQAYLQGEQIDWHILYDNMTIRRVHLPGYYFDGKSYWFDNPIPVALTGSLS